MEKLQVRLKDRPDFVAEAVVGLYEHNKMNRVQVVSESDIRYGKTREFLSTEFSALKTYRDTVIEEIENSGYDFLFIDRYVGKDTENFPYLLRLYFYSGRNLGAEYSESETDELICGFLRSLLGDVAETDKLGKTFGIEELFRVLDNKLTSVEDKMLYLDTFANRRRLVSEIGNYIGIAVPILKKHFHIIEKEFRASYEKYAAVDDWRAFYGYFSVKFSAGVKTLDVNLGVLLFNKIFSLTTPDRGDYSLIGMKYAELKEWERVALVNNGVLLEYLKALSDGTRLRILSELRNRKMRVRDIAKALDLTAPTISHHLSILVRVGIVTASLSHSEAGVCEYGVSLGRIEDICFLLSKLK